jgi:Peptidase C26
MKPKIGITVSQTLEGSLRRLWNGTSLTYARGVLEAGGLPVFLPVLQGTQSLQLETLDGVLFSGGVDVDPEYFGQDHEAGLGEIDPARDEFELELYSIARVAKKPILGICRLMLPKAARCTNTCPTWLASGLTTPKPPRRPLTDTVPGLPQVLNSRLLTVVTRSASIRFTIKALKTQPLA